MADTSFFSGGFEFVTNGPSIKLTSCIGTEVGLDGMYVHLNVYEDMFTNFMSGDITIEDVQGLYDNLPIVGEETLEFKFQSKGFVGVPVGFAGDRKWHTYKVTEMEQPNYHTKMYKIHFSSREFKYNHLHRASKSYKNQRACDIIYNIMTSDPPNGLAFKPSKDHELACETTYDLENYIIPFWHPMDAINHLTFRSRVSYNPEAVNFFFFETREGYYLLSLETMIKMPIRGRMVYGLQNWDADYYTLGSPEILRVEEHFNSHGMMNDGIYASKLTSFDSVKKEMITTVMDYQKDFPKIAHLDVNPLVYKKTDYVSKYDSLHRYLPKPTKLFANESFTERPHDLLLKRRTQTNIIGSFKLYMQLPGNTKHTAGDIIEFDYWMDDPDEPGKKLIKNKYFSGRYMITAVRHTIGKQDYVVNLEMVKESVMPVIGR